MNPYLVNALAKTGENLINYNNQRTEYNDNLDLRQQEMAMRQAEHDARMRQLQMQEYTQAEDLVRKQASKYVLNGSVTGGDGLRSALTKQFGENVSPYLQQQIDALSTELSNEQSFDQFKNDVYAVNMSNIIDRTKGMSPKERQAYYNTHVSKNNSVGNEFVKRINARMNEQNIQDFLQDKNTQYLIQTSWQNGKPQEENIEELRNAYKSMYGDEAEIDDGVLNQFYSTTRMQARQQRIEKLRDRRAELAMTRQEQFEEKLKSQQRIVNNITKQLPAGNVQIAFNMMANSELFNDPSDINKLASTLMANLDQLEDLDSPDQIQASLKKLAGVSTTSKKDYTDKFLTQWEKSNMPVDVAKEYGRGEGDERPTEAQKIEAGLNRVLQKFDEQELAAVERGQVLTPVSYNAMQSKKLMVLETTIEKAMNEVRLMSNLLADPVNGAGNAEERAMLEKQKAELESQIKKMEGMRSQFKMKPTKQTADSLSDASTGPKKVLTRRGYRSTAGFDT